MEFGKFIRSLLPTFSRDQVQEDLDAIRDELDKYVLPVYQTAAKQIGREQFYSADAIAADEIFEKKLNYRYKGNHITAIKDALENSKVLIDLLQTMTDEKFALDVTRAGLDTVRINILQLTEIVGFTVRYARRHLNYILTAEVWHQHPDKKLDGGVGVTPGELEWLKKGRDPFITGLNVIKTPKTDIEVKLKEIPSILVSDESVDTAQAIMGKDKTDPFAMRFIPIVLNPIYHMRIRIAEYQAARYKEAQEERSTIELKLIMLKELEAGKQNAKVEQQIEYNEERLSKLTYKIFKMEEDYA